MARYIAKTLAEKVVPANLAEQPSSGGSNPLSHKAVLAAVTIRRWQGRKLDREITDEINQAHNATADAGRYNKLLIAKEAFSQIDKITSEARTLFYTLTQPWFDEGARLLPTTLYDNFALRFRKLQEDFDKAADEFEWQYPGYVKAAEKRLNGMFKPEDYPPASTVRSLFSMHKVVLPCPDVKDFRVDLAQEQMDDIRSNLERDMKEALESAMKEPINRIITVVERMSERLKVYKPAGNKKGDKAENIFRDSLVGNIRELVDLLPAFNLTDNAQLDHLTNRIKRELCTSEPQMLREDDVLREKVAESADSILKQAQALMA